MVDEEKVVLYLLRTEQPVHKIDELRRIGFFEAPASKNHHLAVEGGLAEHSIHVTDILLETHSVAPVSAYRIGMYHDLVIGMYHDLVKCLCYRAITGGRYEYVQPPYPGHGIASAMIAADIGITLTSAERAAIVWHMGAFGLDERQMAEYDEALRKWPLPIIFTHASDHLASIFEETGVYGECVRPESGGAE